MLVDVEIIVRLDIDDLQAIDTAAEIRIQVHVGNGLESIAKINGDMLRQANHDARAELIGEVPAVGIIGCREYVVGQCSCLESPHTEIGINMGDTHTTAHIGGEHGGDGKAKPNIGQDEQFAQMVVIVGGV